MSAQTSELIYPGVLPVYNRKRELLLYAKVSFAKRLVAEGRVRVLRTKRKAHALEVVPAAEAAIMAVSDSPPTRPRYSHNREVPEFIADRETGELRRVHPLNANPRGVWTLRHIPSQCRSVFCQVQIDCAA